VPFCRTEVYEGQMKDTRKYEEKIVGTIKEKERDPIYALWCAIGAGHK
jgi:hypothetical protein